MDKKLLPFRLFVFILTWMTVQSVSFGQTITLALDTSTIAIGDQTRLTITATRSITQNQNNFIWPDWKDSIPGGLELLEGFDADTSAVDMDNGEMAFAIQRSYLITCWDSGFNEIPPVGIPFGTDTLFSNPAVLNVLLAPRGEEGKIAAAADIRETQWTLAERFWQWLPWILGSLTAIGLILFAVWKWRNLEPRVNPIAPAAQMPQEPAHIVALRELEQIQLDAAWKQGEVKKHHARTSEALRRYLEGRFEFRALERSTQEIKNGVPNLPILDQDREILLEILEMSDLVKFAKLSPTSDDHIRVVKRAIRFIEQTLPTAEVTEANSAT